MNELKLGVGSGNPAEDSVYSEAVEMLQKRSKQNTAEMAQSFGSDIIEPPLPFFDLAHLVLNSTWHARCVDIKAIVSATSGWSVVSDNKTKDTQNEEIKKQIDQMANSLEDITGDRGCSESKNHFDLEGLLKAVATDLESLGNAYVEIVRDNANRPAKFYHVPALTVRLRKGGGYWQMVNLNRGIGETAFTSEKLPAQSTKESYTLFGGAAYQKIYFKEFGDDREFRTDGTPLNMPEGIDPVDYEQLGDKRTEEEKGQDRAQREGVHNPEENASKYPDGYLDDAANEVIHIKNYNPLSPLYGVPAFIASFTAMVSDESAEAWNLAFFENNRVPRWLFKFIGKDLKDKDKKDIQTYFTQILKGRAHVPMVVALSDPESDNETEKVEVDVHEGAVLGMRDKNRDEILSSHGVPPRMLGIQTPGNLGGGGEAQTQREDFRDLVIQPLQKLETSWLNVLILPEWGWEEYKVVLQSFSVQSAEEYKKASEAATKMVERGVVSINEARQRVGLEPIEEEWANGHYLFQGNNFFLLTDESIEQKTEESEEDREIENAMRGVQGQLENKMNPGAKKPGANGKKPGAKRPAFKKLGR